MFEALLIDYIKLLYGYASRWTKKTFYRNANMTVAQVMTPEQFRRFCMSVITAQRFNRQVGQGMNPQFCYLLNVLTNLVGITDWLKSRCSEMMNETGIQHDLDANARSMRVVVRNLDCMLAKELRAKLADLPWPVGDEDIAALCQPIFESLDVNKRMDWVVPATRQIDKSLTIFKQLAIMTQQHGPIVPYLIQNAMSGMPISSIQMVIRGPDEEQQQ